MRFRYSAEGNGKPVKKACVYTCDEHRINFSDVDPHAVYITEKLQSNGYETYIVGGAVRDLLLGKKPKDFDIATSASPGRIKKIFRNSRIIGRRFRLVHVFFGKKIIEVSTFRSLVNGPSSNVFGSIDDDVQRRDFTLNALFYDPLKQLLIDYVEGMKDIKKRVIRPIIPLPHIFTDDPVRIIRALKYAAMTDFKLPLSLKLRIKKNSSLLAQISPSRLTEEIFKIINSPNADKIIEVLEDFGIYRYLQPNAAQLFKSLPEFKTRYLKAFEVLNEDAQKPGKNLSALISTYIDHSIDWDSKEEKDMERFKNVFNLARKFVLPMNPPKVELYNAIRLLFAGHGIIIKKSRYYEKQRRPGTFKNPVEKENPIPVQGAAETHFKRRRKSRSKISG